MSGSAALEVSASGAPKPGSVTGETGDPSSKVLTKEIWERDEDLDAQVAASRSGNRSKRGWPLLFLAWSSVGVIYGDTIGTLFADGAPESDDEIRGGFCMVFWVLTLIVLVKYVGFALRADDNGEGGTFALCAILSRAFNLHSTGTAHVSDLDISGYETGAPSQSRPPSPHESTSNLPAPRREPWLASKVKDQFSKRKSLQIVLMAITLLAVCLVLSDGFLTPAISVVSAAQGIQYQSGISQDAVVGISIGIICIIFLIQQYGTKKVSILFSPFVTLWFLAIAAIGLYNVIKYNPQSFASLSPHYLKHYWQNGSFIGWKNLGAVTLAVTGAEALFADLGHFNARAIRLSWTCLAYPSLTLAYLGQVAYIIHDRDAASSPFWSSIPKHVYWPMVVIATIAAALASQALISGCFSIVQQAVSLNCFPRVTIRHTSKGHKGQIYSPQINWGLMIGTIVVIGIFKTGPGLGAAYGLAVVSSFFLTTLLLALVMLVVWEWNIVFVLLFWIPFSGLEAMLWSANALKVPSGAWFSLMMSAILVTVLATWSYGQRLKKDYQTEHLAYLKEVLLPAETSLSQNERKKVPGAPPALRMAASRMQLGIAPGIGLYYAESLAGIPPVLSFLLPRIPAVHEVMVFITVRQIPIPTVQPFERLLLRKLEYKGFYHVVARYGYMETVEHGRTFVDSLVQEILDLLSPEVAHETEVASQMSETLGGPPEYTLGSASIRSPSRLAAAAKEIAEAHATSKASKQGDEEEGDKTATITGVKETMGLMRRGEVVVDIDPESDSTVTWVQQPSIFRASLRRKNRPTILQAGMFNPDDEIQDERELVKAASAHGCHFILGHTQLRARRRSHVAKKFVVDQLYGTLARNVQSQAQRYLLKPEATIEIGIHMDV